MMQAAKPWHCDDFAARIRLLRRHTPFRSLFVQAKVGSVLVVVTYVLVDEAFQMPFIEHDHMVKQIAAAVANPTLGHAVLPRALERRSDLFDSKNLDCLDDLGAEDRIAVVDQILWRSIVRERLAQLLNDPSAGRVFGNVVVLDSSPVMRNDKEAIEHAKGQRRHSEEIHCGDGFAMIAQKRRPVTRPFRVPGRFSHPAQHSSLGDVEAEHLQLTTNTRRAPGRVFGDHTEDEFLQFFARRPSSHAHSTPGDPFPVQLESGAMPADDGFRLDEDQCALPSRPETPQQMPKQFAESRKSRLRMPGFQDGKLLPQGKIFEQKFPARTRGPGKRLKQQLQRAEHAPVVAVLPLVEESSTVGFPAMMMRPSVKVRCSFICSSVQAAA